LERSGLLLQDNNRVRRMFHDASSWTLAWAWVCDATTREPPGGHLFLNKLWV